ncbi:DsbA family protein [Nereida sp. MMG025]|uniref:DsbA family protein n=1 Tax=Nereida sp. MMG025 TaxID=2909981 RepID=UPI001F3FCD4D|nr:DsbA family protein [Nereida sp. MMG025]MCF6444763.1 DsbA family protein [Nereida sp. MMG025]
MNKGVLAALAAVVAIGAGVAWYLGNSDSTDVAMTDGDTTAEMVDGVTEMTIGDANAPVEIIEYASYTCPHCATFHQGAFKQMKADYIDTGKVKFTYREVYFDRPGLWASMVARCGGQTRFFGISDMIYAQQGEWARLNDPVQIADALRQIGRTAGMNDDEINTCLEDADKAEKLVAWYEANAARHDVTSTPSFVIDGRKYSNMSYEEFQSIIDGKLN